MTSYIGELYTAVYGTLTKNTALTNMLTHGTSAGSLYIYAMQAPDNTTTPYVVYSQQSSVAETPVGLHNTLMFIRAYSPNLTTAANIQGAIEDAIKNVTMATYSNFYTVKDSDFSSVETTPNNTKMYCQGGLFRFRCDK
jgi:hypothetical protein